MSLNIKNGDQLIPVAGTPKVTKSSLELDKVENKTSAEIRDELTLDNVKNAMGDAYLDKTELLSTISASSTTQIRDSKTVEFDGTGKAVEKLVVEGKSVQDGTPSPSAPVEVNGVGNKVENLINIKTAARGRLNTNGGYDSEGNCISLSYSDDGYELTFNSYPWFGCFFNDYIPVNPNASYRFGVDKISDGSMILQARVCYYDIDKNFISNKFDVRNNYTFVTPVDCRYIRVSLEKDKSGSLTVHGLRILSSSLKNKYEPYSYNGKYKIPISSGGKSTNIYLNAPLFDGEIADITSGIVNKKYGMYVLAGNETFTTTSIDSNLVQYAMDKPSDIAATSGYGQPVAICSIATRQTSSTFTANIVGFGNKMGFVVNKSEFANDAAFKEHLTTLYNAGTPAVVVYQLATPTKETFDAPEISTAVGKNTLTVGTEVAPTKIEVTSFGEYYSKAEVDKMLQPLSVTTYTKNDSFVKSEALSGLTVRDETMLQSNSISWAIVLHLTGITIDANTNTIIGTMPNPPKHSFSEMVTVSKSDNTAIISNLVKITFGSSGNVTIESPVAISNGRINTSRYTTANF